MKPRYECTRCGRTEVAARKYGCSNSDRVACPMRLRVNPFLAFLYRKFGIRIP